MRKIPRSAYEGPDAYAEDEWDAYVMELEEIFAVYSPKRRVRLRALVEEVTDQGPNKKCASNVLDAVLDNVQSPFIKRLRWEQDQIDVLEILHHLAGLD